MAFCRGRLKHGRTIHTCLFIIFNYNNKFTKAEKTYKTGSKEKFSCF